MGRKHIGPGPGKYLLPTLVGYRDHDQTKFRYPQYSMGLKLGSLKKNIGPGPKYHTAGFTEHGPRNAPAYGLASRHPPLRAQIGPSPATYKVEAVPRMKEQRPPAYSLRSRHPALRGFQTPGPDKYTMPSTLGPFVPDKTAAGAYTMAARQPLTSKQLSPGPARYNPAQLDRYKERKPIYTMRRRDIGLSEKSRSPGPKYHPKLRQTGGYSFGLKHDGSPYITAADDMPCINK